MTERTLFLAELALYAAGKDYTFTPERLSHTADKAGWDFDRACTRLDRVVIFGGMLRARARRRRPSRGPGLDAQGGIIDYAERRSDD